MNIGLEAIKKRAIAGLEGKTPVNGERLGFSNFAKSFSKDAQDLDKLKTGIQKQSEKNLQDNERQVDGNAR